MKNSFKGGDDFVRKVRSHQVKVLLNDEEMNLLNELTEKRKSDRSSSLRWLLVSQSSSPGESSAIPSLPIEYLSELKTAFENGLFPEDEYKILRSKALGL